MNLKKSGRWLGVVAAVAMLAMVLQGCGSDGGSGISQDMYDTLEMDRDSLQSQLATANTNLMAAQDEVTRLGGELTDATTTAGNLQVQLDAAGDNLTAAQANVTA